MPRHTRIHAPNLLYHIIARGNNRQEIFLNQQAYQKFLSILEKAKEKYPFKLYAYIVMPNHFHLLLEVMKDTTSRIMQSILTGYARYFNERNKRRGHVFEGRYKGIICDKDNYLLELVRYIHLNPVRAKLVVNPGQWVWSGHSEYIGMRKRGLIDSGLVSDIFGRGERGYNKYKRFLEDGMGVGYKDEFHPKESNPFLGSGEFTCKILDERSKRKSNKTISLDDILEKESQRIGIKKDLVTQKVRLKNVSKLKIEFIKKAILENGYSQAEISRYLNCNQSYVSRIIYGR